MLWGFFKYYYYYVIVVLCDLKLNYYLYNYSIDKNDYFGGKYFDVLKEYFCMEFGYNSVVGWL